MSSLNRRYKVLFLTENRPSPTIGGIERATVTTAALLKDRGCQVFYAYLKTCDGESEVDIEGCFHLDRRLGIGQLATFISENRIDVVVNQALFWFVPELKKAIGKNPCRLITAYHYEPIWERNYVRLCPLFNRYKHDKTIVNLLRVVLYPILRIRYLYNCRNAFKRGFKLSDRIVLLSESYRSSFLKYVQESDSAKVCTIPNSIPLIKNEYHFKAEGKEKMILVVSRLEEAYKRISLVLRLWREIFPMAERDGWHLAIVGDGEDKESYEKYIKRYQIKNVTLEGRRTPWEYYRRAAIFLMTSRSEGWPNSLMEAQSFGVVPVVYNTFGTAKEVIADKESGILVPEGEYDVYKQAVLTLMNNGNLRKQMAQSAMAYTKRYSYDTIGKAWMDLIAETTSAHSTYTK